MEKATKLMNEKRWREAREKFSEIIKIDEVENDPLLRAQCYFFIGVTLEGDKNWEEALKAYQSSLILREQFSDSMEIANTLKKVGKMQRELDQFEDAHNSFQKAADLLEEKAGVNWADALFLQASLYLQEKNYQSANGYLQLIQERILDVSKLYFAAEFYNQSGIVNRALGQFQTAINNFMQSLRFYQQKTDYFTTISIILQLADLWRILGDKVKAISFGEDAQKMENMNTSQISVQQKLEIRLKLIEIDFSFDQLDNAETICDEAITLAELNQDQIYLMRFLYQMGRIQIAQSKGKNEVLDNAGKYLEEALHLAEEIPEESFKTQIYLQQARIMKLQNKMDSVFELFDQAKQHAMDLNDSNTLGEVYSQYGIFFHSMGEFRTSSREFFASAGHISYH